MRERRKEVKKEEEGIGCKERVKEVRQGTVVKMCTSGAAI